MVRPFLLSAALALAAAPLPAVEPAPPPRPVPGTPPLRVRVLLPTADAVIGMLCGWLPIPMQTHYSGMTFPSPHYLEHYPQYFPSDPAFPLSREVAAQVQPAAPVPAAAPAKPVARPVGTWVREVGPAKVVLTFTDDRLTATLRIVGGETPASVAKFVLDADYAVGKDGTLFGAIFAADSDNPVYALEFQPLVGQPFAFGWRVDGETLSVRNVRCLGAGLPADNTSELADLPMMVGGRYTRMDGAKLAEWEKKPPALGGPALPLTGRHVQGRCEAAPVLSPPTVRTIQALPDGTTVERVGVDFNGPFPPAPSAGSAPRVSPPPIPNGPLPTATYLPVPPPIGVPGGAPAQPGSAGIPLPPLPTPSPWVEAPPTFPGPRSYPHPAAPSPYLPPPLPSSAPVLPAGFVAPQPMVAPAGPNPLLGTWVRDIGAMQVTVKFTPKQVHVRMTLDPVGEKDLREVLGTADYTLSPDGKRVEGTITGADVKTSKRVTYFEADEPLKAARCFDGEPVGFTVHVDDGVLSIRDVRVGKNAGKPAADTNPFAGIYTREPDNAAKPWNTPQKEEKVSQPGVARPPVLPPQSATPPAAAEGPPPPGPAPKPAIALGTFTGQTFRDPLAMQREIERMEAPPAAANPLLGTWVREQDGLQVVLRLAEKRMTLEFNMALAGPGATLPAPGTPLPDVARVHQTFDADYSIGPDGTLFGVFTGADIKVGDSLTAEIREAVSGIRGELAKGVGSMFKFRVRLDGGVLNLLSPVFESPGEKGEKGAKAQDEVLAGRYERVTGKVPPPKPGAWFHHQFSGDPNVRTPQSQNPSEDLRPVVRPPLVVPPAQSPAVEGGSGVGPRSALPPAANPLHGTWVREENGMQTVLTFTEKRIHAELNVAMAVPGEATAKFTQSLDADYSASPDGTVFGVLTGMDMTFDGFPPEVRASAAEARGQMAKMTGAVFKFRGRVDGDRLSVAEVFLAPPGGGLPNSNVPADQVVGGTFRRVTGKVPAPKPGAGFLINQYSSDPTARVQQLQNQPEDLKQVESEWKRFWSNDGPTAAPAPAPKCRECAPAPRPTGETSPTPIPMSRG